MGKQFSRINGYLRNDSSCGLNLAKKQMKQFVQYVTMLPSILRKWVLLPYSPILRAKNKSNVDCFSPVSRLYFQGNTSEASEAPSARKSTSTLDNLIVPVSAAKTEVRWVLKMIDFNFPLRSCLYLNDLFQVMLLNSEIAQNFQLSKTKCGHYINFDVAPYVRKILKETMEILHFLTVLFRESLNGYVQKEQMVIKIRFWCNDKCKMTTRYLDSKFLARGYAESISSTLIEALDGLGNRNCLILTMNGPNNNWSVLEKVPSHGQQMELASSFDVGCYGFHIVHGVFQTGAVATNA